MNASKVTTTELHEDEDVVHARQAVRQWGQQLGFSLVDQTKLVTAASELARNAITHGGGGKMDLEVLDAGSKQGLRLTFTDQGPGIADVDQALQDSFTTGGGLGMGLGGAKRLVNEFDIRSKPGEGTQVTVTRWK